MLLILLYFSLESIIEKPSHLKSLLVMHVKFKFTDATFSSILRGTDWSPERLANLMYTSQNQRWLQVGLVSTLLEILPGKERIQNYSSPLPKRRCIGTTICFLFFRQAGTDRQHWGRNSPSQVELGPSKGSN